MGFLEEDCMIDMDKWDIVFGVTIVMVIGCLISIYTTQDNTINTHLNTIQQQKVLMDYIALHNQDLTQTALNQQDTISDYNYSMYKLSQEIQDYKDIIVYKDEQFERKLGTVRKPTYKEVTDFLRDDRTDNKVWTEEFDCTQFAHEVIRNAQRQGIYGCVVTIDYDNHRGHNIIVFMTDDMGIQYFEPQSDENVYMYLGMDYAGYLGYGSDVSFIVRQFDSCYERRMI